MPRKAAGRRWSLRPLTVGALAPSCFEAEGLVKENWWGFRSADFNSNSLSKSVSLGPFPSSWSQRVSHGSYSFCGLCFLIFYSFSLRNPLSCHASLRLHPLPCRNENQTEWWKAVKHWCTQDMCIHTPHVLLHPHPSPDKAEAGTENGGEGSTDLTLSTWGYLGRSRSFPEPNSWSTRCLPGRASEMIWVTPVTCPPFSVGPRMFRRWELKSNHI